MASSRRTIASYRNFTFTAYTVVIKCIRSSFFKFVFFFFTISAEENAFLPLSNREINILWLNLAGSARCYWFSNMFPD